MSDDTKKGIMFNVNQEKHDEISSEAKSRRQTIKAYILSLHDKEMDRINGNRVLNEGGSLNSTQNRGFRISKNIYVSNYQTIWILVSFGLIVGMIGISRDTVLFPLYLGLVIISIPFLLIRVFSSFPSNQFHIVLKLILGIAMIILLLTGNLLIQEEGDYLTTIIFSSSVVIIGIIIVHLKTEFFSKRIDQLAEYYKNRSATE